MGHNFLGYDAPTLNRLLACAIRVSSVVDTMVLSMLYNPSLDGGHSLEMWGTRLKFPKGDFHDFSQYSEEMLQYCLQDARLTRRIYLELIRRMTRLGFTGVGLEIEHRAWALTKKQTQHGFAFDIAGAHALLALLHEEANAIRDRVYEFWPPELKLVATYRKPYKKDGAASANFLRHSSEYERVDVHPDKEAYDCHAFVPFNIGSPDQRVGKLLELGWKPREFTEGGNPQPTRKGKLSPSLEEFVEETAHEGPRLIARWIEVNSRATMIETWIEAYNNDTGCIHGTLWLANTLRYRHSGPNTANIPAVKLDKADRPLRGADGAWTYEARDLWVVRNRTTRRLVGVDAKGIQLRVLAHYLNNKEFTDAVLSGDPHSYNQRVGGLATRALAKTFIYAFLLGAGDAKIGEIIGGSSRDGRDLKSRFIGNFPGLKQLLDRLEREISRTGRIRLCDGTPLLVTAPHTRLGYLLQGDESRIMKKAAILTAADIARRKLDVIKVGDIHDEWQNDTALAAVDEFRLDVLPRAFADSGRFFQYLLPIDCDSKVGLTWAETH